MERRRQLGTRQRGGCAGNALLFSEVFTDPCASPAVRGLRKGVSRSAMPRMLQAGVRRVQ